MADAVIFDLDGVLLDSEQLWNQVKRGLVEDSGGSWLEQAPEEMMGMSSPEWSAYMRSALGVPMEEAAINAEVVARMEAAYRRDLPLLAGAVEAVERIGGRWPVAIASSSNREIIDAFVELAGLAGTFASTISSEQVDRGKPAPDVYLRVASELGAGPESCVAVEDSANGLAAAAAAGMSVVAIPNPHYPPAAERLELATVTIGNVDELTLELIERIG